MKKLAVDLIEVAAGFEDASGLIERYLDLETGEVIPITEEISGQLEDLYAWAKERDPEATPDLPALIEEEGLHGWQEDALLEADQVRRGFGRRYVQVPHADSHEGYRDMEDFIDTVENARLHQRLERAIHGRGAFRRFKDALLDDPAERERWFDFKDDRIDQRVVEWLDSLGIEPIVDEGAL
jgi:hypothetical protein